MQASWFLEGAVAGGRGLLIAIDTRPFRGGQESTCEPPVAAKDKPRRHARLERDGADGLKVTDLSSTNGTFVNRTVMFDRNAVLRARQVRPMPGDSAFHQVLKSTDN